VIIQRGQYKGQSLQEVPDQYLIYLRSRSQIILNAVDEEQARRGEEGATSDQIVAARIIAERKRIERANRESAAIQNELRAERARIERATAEMYAAHARLENAQRAAALPQGDTSWMGRIIQAGFRQLALQNHPDHGGDNKTMRELLGAKAELARMLGGHR